LEYLTKPLDLERFLDVIDEIVGVAEPTRTIVKRIDLPRPGRTMPDPQRAPSDLGAIAPVDDRT
jgi:hypothetical protein